MKITTPSGFEANFIDVEELNYGQRRQIQKILFRNTRASFKDTDVIFDSQDEILKIVLVSLTVGEKTITNNFIEEIATWKKLADGEAIYKEVAQYIDEEQIFGISKEDVGKKK